MLLSAHSSPYCLVCNTYHERPAQHASWSRNDCHRLWTLFRRTTHHPQSWPGLCPPTRQTPSVVLQIPRQQWESCRTAYRPHTAGYPFGPLPSSHRQTAARLLCVSCVIFVDLKGERIRSSITTIMGGIRWLKCQFSRFALFKSPQAHLWRSSYSALDVHCKPLTSGLSADKDLRVDNELLLCSSYSSPWKVEPPFICKFMNPQNTFLPHCKSNWSTLCRNVSWTGKIVITDPTESRQWYRTCNLWGISSVWYSSPRRREAENHYKTSTRRFNNVETRRWATCSSLSRMSGRFEREGR